MCTTSSHANGAQGTKPYGERGAECKQKKCPRLLTCSPFLTITRFSTARSGDTMQPRTDLRRRSPVETNNRMACHTG